MQARSNVFCYGTLMAREVTTALLGHLPAFEPATLKGHKRYGIKGQVFPAIVVGDDADVVQGVVYEGLSPRDMDIFDEFEDVEYYRTTVTVHTSGGKPVQAEVYIWQEVGRSQLQGTWDYERFRKEHLTRYLRNCQPSSGHPLEAEIGTE